MILSPLICTFNLLSAGIAFCKKHTNRHKIREVLTFQDFPYSGPEGNRTHNHRFHECPINSVFSYFMRVSQECYKPVSCCFFSQKRSFSPLCNTKCNTKSTTDPTVLTRLLSPLHARVRLDTRRTLRGNTSHLHPFWIHQTAPSRSAYNQMHRRDSSGG